MTPTLLLVVLAALALVLVALLVGIWRKLRARGADSPQPPTTAKVREPAAERTAAPAGPVPGVQGRTRRLRAASEGGGDPGPMDQLFSSGVYAQVERKLEQAFDLLARGRISITTYLTLVQNEAEAVARERAKMNASEQAGAISDEMLSQQREDIETAEIAVQWCLDWAAEYGGHDGRQEAPPAELT